MTRTITFGPCKDATTQKPSLCCQRFVLLYNAFTAGGNRIYAPQQGQRPADERRKEAKILRAFDGISEVVDEATGGRKLLPEGGTLVLDQDLFVVLEKYLDAAPAPTELSREIADLLDWVSAAEKSDS